MGLIGDNGNNGDISGFVLEARTLVMINMKHVPIMNLHRQWLSPGGSDKSQLQGSDFDQSAVKICKL